MERMERRKKRAGVFMGVGRIFEGKYIRGGFIGDYLKFFIIILEFLSMRISIIRPFRV